MIRFRRDVCDNLNEDVYKRQVQIHGKRPVRWVVSGSLLRRLFPPSGIRCPDFSIVDAMAILFAAHCGKRLLVHGQAIVAKGGD